MPAMLRNVMWRCRSPVPVALRSNWNRYLRSGSRSGTSSEKGKASTSGSSCPEMSSSSSSGRTGAKITNDAAAAPAPGTLRSVYVHPMSRRVLLMLQAEDMHPWIIARGLDRGLTLHRDGTFCLHFPTTTAEQADDDEEEEEASLPDSNTAEQLGESTVDSTADDYQSRQPLELAGRRDGLDDDDAEDDSRQSPRRRRDRRRIWTSFHPVSRKQHWLSFQSGRNVHHRFPLVVETQQQDEKLPDSYVENVVRQLIEAVEFDEREQRQRRGLNKAKEEGHDS